MKVVAKVKLDVSAQEGQILRRTVEACNHAANEVSKIAHEQNIRDKRKLREATYAEAKPIVGASQAAQAVIRKVADAYKAHRANLKADNHGKRGTDRRAKAEQKVITFRPEAAQPYDARNLTWDIESQSVRIWVIDSGDGTPRAHPHPLHRVGPPLGPDRGGGEDRGIRSRPAREELVSAGHRRDAGA